MTCRRLQMPFDRAPQEQRQLACISSAAQGNECACHRLLPIFSTRPVNMVEVIVEEGMIVDGGGSS